MKQRNALAAGLALVLLLTAFVGCAASAGSIIGGQAMQVAAVQAKGLQQTDRMEPSAAQAARGANEFALRLSAALAAQAGAGNFVCSPYSVWLPLAALANATDTAHKADLLAALGAAGITEADLNRAASRMLYDLTRQQDKEEAQQNGQKNQADPLKIANAVFVGDKVTINKDFAQNFIDFYRGNVIQVDFTTPKAVVAVNQWCKENTEGLIPQIVDEFDPNTVAAIANAIYFSDRWSREFKPSDTHEDVFHSLAGDTKAQFMQLQGDALTYYQDDQLQAINLGFKTDGGMYILLPRDGNAKSLLSGMTKQTLDKILAGQTKATGKLLLPRFTIESGPLDIADTLTALGVPLFDSKKPALTGGLIQEKTPMWLSGALHKALIRVDEKGTTAAAITLMVGTGGMAPPPTEPFEMNCNKPFVFVLYGRTQDNAMQILFTGMVNKP